MRAEEVFDFGRCQVAPEHLAGVGQLANDERVRCAVCLAAERQTVEKQGILARKKCLGFGIIDQFDAAFDPCVVHAVAEFGDDDDCRLGVEFNQESE